MAYWKKGTQDLKRSTSGSPLMVVLTLMMLSGLLSLSLIHLAFAWSGSSQLDPNAAVITLHDEAYIVTYNSPQDTGLISGEEGQPGPSMILPVLSYLPPQLIGLYSFRG